MATMGIRGTVGFATINSSVENGQVKVEAKFATLVHPDGAPASRIDLLGANGQVVSSMTQAGTFTVLTSTGGAPPVIAVVPMTVADAQEIAAVIANVANIAAAAQQNPMMDVPLPGEKAPGGEKPTNAGPSGGSSDLPPPPTGNPDTPGQRSSLELIQTAQ